MRTLDIYVEEVFDQDGTRHALVSVNDDERDEYFPALQVEVAALSALGAEIVAGKSTSVTVSPDFEVTSLSSEAN